MTTLSEEKQATNEAKKLILGDLWGLCYQAHSATSFSPEKRANSYVKTTAKCLKKI